MSEHVHSVEHAPAIISGYGVCECGATIRVFAGRTVGDWHACKLCVLGYSPDQLQEFRDDAEIWGEGRE